MIVQNLTAESQRLHEDVISIGACKESLQPGLRDKMNPIDPAMWIDQFPERAGHLDRLSSVGDAPLPPKPMA